MSASLSADDVREWISAIGGTAGFAALLVTLVRDRRRRARPPQQLPELLQELERTFSDIVAGGGQDTSYFLDPSRQSFIGRLAMTAGTVVDDSLNAAIGAAQNNYLDCWSWAPAPGANAPSSMKDNQIEAARSGRSHAVKAIDRMNSLYRKYPLP